MDRCRSETPPLAQAGPDPGHQSACWLSRDEAVRRSLRRQVTGESLPAAGP
jgi:peptide/nickel transport system ATP-binding protein